MEWFVVVHLDPDTGETTAGPRMCEKLAKLTIKYLQTVSPHEKHVAVNAEKWARTDPKDRAREFLS
jgi:hypothetical protein